MRTIVRPVLGLILATSLALHSPTAAALGAKLGGHSFQLSAPAGWTANPLKSTRDSYVALLRSPSGAALLVFANPRQPTSPLDLAAVSTALLTKLAGKTPLQPVGAPDDTSTANGFPMRVQGLIAADKKSVGMVAAIDGGPIVILLFLVSTPEIFKDTAAEVAPTPLSFTVDGRTGPWHYGGAASPVATGATAPPTPATARSGSTSVSEPAANHKSLPPTLSGGRRLEGAFVGSVRRNVWDSADEEYEREWVNRWYVFTRRGYYVMSPPAHWRLPETPDDLAAYPHVYAYRVQGGKLESLDADGKHYTDTIEIVSPDKVVINGSTRWRMDNHDYDHLALQGKFCNNSTEGSPLGTLTASVSGSHCLTFHRNHTIESNDYVALTGVDDNSAGGGPTTYVSGGHGQRKGDGRWAIRHGELLLTWPNGTNNALDLWCFWMNPGNGGCNTQLFLNGRQYVK